MVRLQLVVWVSLLFAGCNNCAVDETGERERRARVDLTLISDAANTFARRAGRAPANLREMAPPDCSGELCVFGELPSDPWGRSFVSVQLSADALRFVSLGPDGRLDTHDDLSQAWTLNPANPTRR